MFALLLWQHTSISTDVAWAAAQMHNRTDTRERYGIRGNAHRDCLTALCCCSCAHTQERREIKLEEESFRK
jgi:Cys-rich protein (TIGR01571 family)